MQWLIIRAHTHHRLEAATSRLEDLAAIPSGGGSSSIAASNPGTNTTGSTTSIQSSSAPVVHQDPPVLQDFDALINNEVKKYVGLSSQLGGLVAEQVLAISIV